MSRGRNNEILTPETKFHKIRQFLLEKHPCKNNETSNHCIHVQNNPFGFRHGTCLNFNYVIDRRENSWIGPGYQCVGTNVPHDTLGINPAIHRFHKNMLNKKRKNMDEKSSSSRSKYKSDVDILNHPCANNPQHNQCISEDNPFGFHEPLSGWNQDVMNCLNFSNVIRNPRYGGFGRVCFNTHTPYPTLGSNSLMRRLNRKLGSAAKEYYLDTRNSSLYRGISAMPESIQGLITEFKRN